MRPHPTPPRRGEEGQGLVEFALVLPILVFVLLVAVDFGRIFFAVLSVTNAARVGAEYAMDYQVAAGGGPAEAERRVRQRVIREAAPFVPLAEEDIEIQASWLPSQPGADSRVSITVRWTFEPLTPFIAGLLPAEQRLVSRTATVRHNFEPIFILP